MCPHRFVVHSVKTAAHSAAKYGTAIYLYVYFAKSSTTGHIRSCLQVTLTCDLLGGGGALNAHTFPARLQLRFDECQKSGFVI